MIAVLLWMIGGIGLGYLIRESKRLLSLSEKLVTAFIFLLLLFLGIGVGQNRTIIEGLDTIGYTSLIITTGAVLGSVLCSWIIYKLLFKRC